MMRERVMAKTKLGFVKYLWHRYIWENVQDRKFTATVWMLSPFVWLAGWGILISMDPRMYMMDEFLATLATALFIFFAHGFQEVFGRIGRKLSYLKEEYEEDDRF